MFIYSYLLANSCITNDQFTKNTQAKAEQELEYKSDD